MGEVWRARDTRVDRMVALKVLPEALFQDAQRRARFEREARLLASLNHPGIATLYSFEEVSGRHLLAMELVEGEGLDRRIAAGALSVEEILSLAGQIAEALAAAHEKGVVHRDLKPANVRVTTDGRVKLLDFGLARRSGEATAGSEDETTTGALTREGVVLGTLPYMSPEQVSGRSVDHRTDVFSLGTLLHEMATGRRPFEGRSPAELTSAILRDTPAPVTGARSDLPVELARLVRRCLEKDPRRRAQTARDVGNELLELADRLASGSARASGRSPSPATGAGSGAARQDEGFRVAVLPFRCRGGGGDLEALADGMTEEIVTGLSRFSYLRVIARSSTLRYAREAVDVRTAGRELGARYVMEGSLRQAGTRLRVAVQLVDAGTLAHLWAETYERTFAPEEAFALQDDLVPRIVSTVADWYGVLPQGMSEAVRGKAADELSPYEAVLRCFGTGYRASPAERAAAVAAVEAAVRKAPSYSDGWAMLATAHVEEYAEAFGARPDSLELALAAARRAVDAAPSNPLAHAILARALFFRREMGAFRVEAERALALNPMDGALLALMGELIAYAGDWERGCALVERAAALNPRHPGWYWLSLSYDAYRRRDYRGTLAFALRTNLPDFFHTHVLTASAHAQLGDREAAERALAELVRLERGFGAIAREELGKRFASDLVEHLVDGLRRAGLDVPVPAARPVPAVREAAVSIAVLPFSDLSPAKDQEHLCEGMAEEIMNALVGIDGLRVASRTSAFRARRHGEDLPAIGRTLSVGHVLEGSVRTSGSRLRVTAQLTDVATGFQLWSRRFDREAADVFAVQDEIAAGVVEAVRSRLAPGQPAPKPRPQVGNLEAYQHYLKGRHLRYTKNDHGDAARAFEKAVALDPSHGPSWIGLAEVEILAATYGLRPAGEAYAAAKSALATGRRLQPESGEVLYVEGMIAEGERRWDDADRALERATRIEPVHVAARCWLGVLLSIRGRVDAALPVLRDARGLDPLSPYPYGMTGLCLLHGRRAEEADGHLEQALAFDDANGLALWASGAANVARGRFDLAIARLEKALGPARSGGFLHGALGWALAASGRTEEARAVLVELRARPAPAPAVLSEAWLLASLGERDAAFAVLERTADEGNLVVALTGLPGFDPLRDDPRFPAFRSRLGLAATEAST